MFGLQIIPQLLAVLENLNSPRVASHAGAALVNFSEDAPKHVVVSYLDPMMRKLEWVLQQTMKQVRKSYRQRFFFDDAVFSLSGDGTGQKIGSRANYYHDRVGG